MWRPIEIEFKNLFSHLHSQYRFNNGVCTVIFGENRTDSGATNNGAGKSTLFEAVALALLGRSLRCVNKDSFINRDSEDCYIRFVLSNNALKATLKIERWFYRGGKSAKIKITENDVENSQLVSVNEANHYILESLGITAEDLLRYFIIYQGNPYTFFTAGDVEKKEVLNRITSADVIMPKIEELKTESKKLDARVTEIENEITRIDAKRETYEERRQELLEAPLPSVEIEATENLIKKFRKRQEEQTNVISDNQNKIATWRKELNKLVIPDGSELTKALQESRKRKEKLEEELSSAKSLLRTMQDELTHTITCPNCNHEFVNESNSELSVEQIRVLIPDVEKEVENFKGRIEKLNLRIKKQKSSIEEIETLESQALSIKRKIKRLEAETSEAEDSIKTYKNRIKKYEAEIKELKNVKRDEAGIKSCEEKIKSCEEKIKSYNAELSGIRREKEMADYWIYYLGKSGFQTYLANRSIMLFQGYVNSFLKKLKTDLTVDISGFKILSDRTVREKIEVRALSKGVNAELLPSKSGGEQGRINLAGILAIQHLINMSTDGRGLDLLLLDETLASIDTAGTENIIRVLEELGVTILMITQNVTEDYNNNYKIRVIKENGISCLN